ncbi:hypothetical protein F4810DRAFT_596118 [Camillea tinctor]|nr:hypothetical protein F4810DRAFT_596118 [Camillea tinctor]
MWLISVRLHILYCTILYCQVMHLMYVRLVHTYSVCTYTELDIGGTVYFIFLPRLSSISLFLSLLFYPPVPPKLPMINREIIKLLSSYHRPVKKKEC